MCPTKAPWNTTSTRAYCPNVQLNTPLEIWIWGLPLDVTLCDPTNDPWNDTTARSHCPIGHTLKELGYEAHL